MNMNKKLKILLVNPEVPTACKPGSTEHVLEPEKRHEIHFEKGTSAASGPAYGCGNAA
jgi:hypothetical protein